MRFMEKLVYTHFGVSNRSRKLGASARKGTSYAVPEPTPLLLPQAEVGMQPKNTFLSLSDRSFAKAIPGIEPLAP